MKGVKKGVKVKVISGDYRGQEGEILMRKGDKVIVQGINLCKKHTKKSEQNPNGGIVEYERPIHISNIALINEKTN